MEEIEVLDLGENKVEKPKTKTGTIVGIIVLAIIIIIGIVFITKGGTDKIIENKMKKASADYFRKYMSTNASMSTYIVTLDMLKSANIKDEDYDLKGLEKCNSSATLSRITVDYKTGEPKNIEVELKC